MRIPGSKSQLKSGKKMIIIITRSTTTIAWRIHVGWETREEEECQEMASDATTHSHRKRRGQHCASGGSPLMIGTRGGMRMAYLLKGLLWGLLCGEECVVGAKLRDRNMEDRKLLWSECVPPKFSLKS